MNKQRYAVIQQTEREPKELYPIRADVKDCDIPLKLQHKGQPIDFIYERETNLYRFFYFRRADVRTKR